MDVIFLIIQAAVVYGLVLLAHAVRHRWSMYPFYSLLGCLTALMAWVTDSGAAVQIGGMTFLVGSTVYYSALLLGILVVYVFDGPQATQRAIFIIIGASILAPLAASAVHLLAALGHTTDPSAVPRPSLRINTASVMTSFIDFIFLAVSWEFFNRSQKLHLAIKVLLVMMGVMCLDGVLFTAGAFAGHRDYMAIFGAALTTRFLLSLAVAPVVWLYIQSQFQKPGTVIINRPLLAILQRMTEMEVELGLAHSEIARRKKAERELRRSEERLACAIEASGAAVYEVDVTNPDEVYVSDKWSEILGYDKSDLPKGRSIIDFWLSIIHPDERGNKEKALLDFMQGSQSKLDLEFRARRKDGSWAFIHEMARVLERDPNGAPLKMVGVQLDISDRKLAELEREQLIDELELAQEDLLSLSLRDGLTGLANRRHLDQMLPQYLGRARAAGVPLSVIMADIDYFKNYNDTYGHLKGDECLKDIAEVLQSVLHRPDDFVARYGGEEFVMILPGADARGASLVAEAARRAVQELGIEHLSSSVSQVVTISLGVATNAAHTTDSAVALLEKADSALYRAKEQGRNRVSQVEC